MFDGIFGSAFENLQSQCKHPSNGCAICDVMVNFYKFLEEKKTKAKQCGKNIQKTENHDKKNSKMSYNAN